MRWPLSQDYNEAIQNPTSCFGDPELKQGEVACNAMGLPVPCSGNFADVYQVRKATLAWAVKCFTREIPGLRERYIEISAYLQKVQLPFMVAFNYLDQGIRVRGQWYPVLKMDWVEGFTLNHFIKLNLDKPQVLEKLAQLWVSLARLLREANLAHCDLQHGNVLLVPGRKAGSLAIKLVDYDGMCVPALTLLKSIELGHPAYQHPQRLRDGAYGLEVDRFSHLVIFTALRSLMIGGKALWEKHDNGDNLLFKQVDLAAPNDSPLFHELSNLDDPAVRLLVVNLIEAARKPLHQTPLLEEVMPETGPPPSRPPAEVAVHEASVGETTPPAARMSDADEFAPVAEPSSRLSRWWNRKIRGIQAWVWVVMVAALAMASFFLGGAMSEVYFATRGLADKLLAVVRMGGKQEESTGKTAQPASTPLAGEMKLGNHQGGVLCLAYSPNGRVVASGGSDKTIRLWDVEHGREVGRLEGHQGAVKSVAFTPDSSRLLSGGADKTMRLWDLASRQEIGRFEGFNDSVLSVAISPDGRRALSTGLGTIVRLWDLETRQEIRRFQHPNVVFAVAFSPDGELILTGVGEGIQRINPIYLWDADSGKELRRFIGHSNYIESVSFSSDGTKALSGSLDGSTSVWEVKTGKELQRMCGYVGLVRSVAFSPNNHLVLVGAGEMAKVYDEATGEQLCSYWKANWCIRSVAFAPDGRQIIYGNTSDGTIILQKLPLLDQNPLRIDRPSLDTTRKADKLQPLNKGEVNGVPSIQLAPLSDVVLMAGESRSIEVRVARHGCRGPIRVEVQGLPGKVTADPATMADGQDSISLNLTAPADNEEGESEASLLAFLGDLKAATKMRITVNRPPSVRVLPIPDMALEAGKPRAVTLKVQRQHCQGLVEVQWLGLPDKVKGGPWVLDSDQDTVQVQLQAAADVGDADQVTTVVATLGGLKGEQPVKVITNQAVGELRRLGGSTGAVKSVAFSPDGRQALSAGIDKVIRLWDLNTGKELRRFEGHTDEVTSVAFSSDGASFLSGSYDTTVRLWDVQTGKELRRLKGHTKRVTCVAFSADGKWALSSSYDLTLRLWDVQTGKELGRFKDMPAGFEVRPTPRPAPQEVFLSVAFSPDGRQVLSGGLDGSLRLWDVQTAFETRRFLGHKRSVLSVAFSPDGRHILSGSSDKTVRYWDVVTGVELAHFTDHTAAVESVAFSPDGHRALSGGMDKTVRLWDLDNAQPLHRFEGHKGEVMSVTFSADGRRALSGSYDKTVRLWGLPW